MLELEISGQRTPVPVGELVIGSDPSCGLRLGGDTVRPRHAVVVGLADGSAAVRREDLAAEVSVNGVRLGGEPAPILHGDKLQVGPHELLVTDPRRGGSTQFVSASDVARMVAATAPSGAPRAPTGSTGGRLVCLTDGREYTIGAAPVVIGREAGCDVVVPNKDVSRHHAEIFASSQGYLLVDSSTNGTFVNGERIEGQRVLARADVIRIGDHEFRFYADRVPETPPVPAPPAAALGATGAEPATGAPSAPEGAAARLAYTMAGVPPSPPADVPFPRAEPPEEGRLPIPAAMATLLVRSGQLKGTRFPIRVPVVNIGRADFNDIVIPDESVSGMHAKLQRREGIWVISDNESTNGTFVDGERVRGEAPVSPGAVVRLGEVSVMFEPTDDHLGTAAGTGTKVVGAVRSELIIPEPVPLSARSIDAPPAERIPDVAAPAPRVAIPPARRHPVVVSSPPRREGLPRWVLPAIVVVVLAVLALVLFSR